MTMFNAPYTFLCTTTCFKYITTLVLSVSLLFDKDNSSKNNKEEDDDHGESDSYSHIFCSLGFFFDFWNFQVLFDYILNNQEMTK